MGEIEIVRQMLFQHPQGGKGCIAVANGEIVGSGAEGDFALEVGGQIDGAGIKGRGHGAVAQPLVDRGGEDHRLGVAALCLEQRIERRERGLEIPCFAAMVRRTDLSETVDWAKVAPGRRDPPAAFIFPPFPEPS